MSTSSDGRKNAIAMLLVVSLCGAADARPPAKRWPRIELPRLARHQQQVRRHLGRDRWRLLDAARFEISLDRLGLEPRLSEHPNRRANVERVLLRSLFKLSEETLEERFQLDERLESLGRRLPGGHRGLELRGSGPGVKISPKLRLTNGTSIGAKLRLVGTRSRLGSRTNLRIRRELRGADLEMKLSFEHRDRVVFLVYHSDHNGEGKAAELRVAFSL